MPTFGKNFYEFSKEELDLSNASPIYQKRVGMVCKHYTVLSLYAVARTNKGTDRKGNRYTIPVPYYKVQCKYNPNHIYVMSAEDIDKRQNFVRCPCHDMVRRMGVRERSGIKHNGEVVAGCECIRRSDNDDNWSMPVFVYRCPYCGAEFERRRVSMLNFERAHPGVNAGCDRCLEKHHLKFKSKWLKDEIRQAAKHELSQLFERIHNPFFRKWNDYGGRGIKLDPCWDATCGIYTTEECLDHIMQFMIDNDWEPGLEIDRINANGHYTPDNCRFIEKGKQSDNRRNTLCAQFGSTVYIGSEFTAVYKTTISTMRKDKRQVTTALTNIYNRTYGVKRDILVCKQPDGSFRDNHGFLIMMPALKIFNLYPDDINPAVKTYQEYLERLAYNLKHGIKSRVPVSLMSDLDKWITSEDLASVGITDITQYQHLLSIATDEE